MASMAQIDKSLDEASTTLGAHGFTTLRRVLLPLLKPAVVAALVYSFVRSMTTVSAIVFLVSAEYEWATTYIINRVTNGDYGVSIAYSSVLIVLMVPVHLPSTIFGKYIAFCSSVPTSSSASMAPCVSRGHSANARLAPCHISSTAVDTSCGRPCPPCPR